LAEEKLHCENLTLLLTVHFKLMPPTEIACCDPALPRFGGHIVTVNSIKAGKIPLIFLAGQV
jgi:hypothetical protein